MRIARVLLASCLALGLSLTTQAKTTHLGLLKDGAIKTTHGKVQSGTFSDTVTFRLASESSVSDSFDALVKGITSFTVSLFLDKTQLATFSGTSKQGSPFSVFYPFGDLAASSKGSHYTLDITGTGFKGGKYANVLGVSAVPEADAWLMLLAGFGLIGFQLRRKQQSLPQRPIN